MVRMTEMESALSKGSGARLERGRGSANPRITHEGVME